MKNPYISERVRERIFGRMGKYIKENLEMIKRMVQGRFNFRTGENTSVSGLMINNMEKDNFG